MFEGKLALVTGSTSGIGLAIARALGAKGCRLVLNGFGDPAEIERLRAGLAGELGVEVAFEAADLSRSADVESLMDRCQALGGVDILVNNAGIQHVAPVEQFAAEKWEAVIALNLSAAFHATRKAVPTMKERNWGRIINVASVHGLVASVEKSAYVAAKHGLVGLTKVVALELARTGVTCNAICPGWVLTPLVQKQIDARASAQSISADDAKNALLAEKQPSLDFVTTEQLGELVLFLCSPAADQVRGVAWAMDGGWTAQ